ncbi:MAG TPA: ATP-binding protein [Candidatus Xenobia bacterium]|jgi:two-component system phosphate regulon sensor histidine kinase PhoR
MKIRGIRYRLSLSYLLVLLISMVFTTLLFLRFAQQYVQQRVGEQLQNQAEFVARVLSQSNSLPDNSDLPMAVTDFQLSFGGELKTRVAYTNAEGTVISGSGGLIGQQLNVPDLQSALSGSLKPWVSLEVGHSVLHATAPLKARGETLGLVDLSTPVESSVDIKDLRGLLLWALCASLGPSLLLSVLFSRSLTRPMAGMQQAARKISAGDLSARVEALDDDEIGDLGRAINSMAVDLQDRMLESTRERARMQTLLESLVDGVVALDGRGRVNFLNSAARTILGFSLPEVLKRPLVERWEDPEVAALLDECQTKRGMATIEMNRDARRLQVFAVPYDLPEALTTTIGGFPIMLVLRDVTDLRRLEEVRQTFLGSVSHELRTPLTIIKGFAVTMADSPLLDQDPLFKRSVGVIDRETDRLSRLVEDVLELSRLRSHRLELERSLMEPDPLVADALAVLDAKAKDLDVALVVALGAEGHVVMADQDRLHQIVVNLVDNALKFTPPGGQVTVRTEVRSDGWQMTVSDTGLGIPAEDVPYLFERFFRGRDRKKKGIAGSGLGLSIVKELVDLHDGRIEVESELDRGTTMRVRFPAVRPQEPGPTTT